MRPGERVVGRFEILGEAGRGGMGTVFRARDLRDGRDVAVKVLRGDRLGDAARFELEAQVLARVDHPNVVEYVTHGATTGDLRFLVMEWVAGETLAERLGRRGVAPAEAVAIAAQVAAALAAVHAAGVVHRDVKPSNLMLLDGDGLRVKLVDLGVARVAASGLRLTDTGASVGTAGYMAPEQVRGLRDAIDGRTDLFALGCVLFECLTGAPAFAAESRLATRAKVLMHDPPRLRLVDPDLPAALELLVASLLARDPAARPPDAAAVGARLAALDALPPRRPWPSSPSAPSAPATPPTRPEGLAGTAATGTTQRSRNDRFPTSVDRTHPTRNVGFACTERACYTSSQASGLAAVMIAWGGADADDGQARARAALPARHVEVIDGGLLALCDGDLVRTAAAALRLAAACPEAVIVVGGGASPAAALDEVAAVMEEVEIAGDDAPGAGGVWAAAARAPQLAAAFRLARAPGRVRLAALAGGDA